MLGCCGLFQGAAKLVSKPLPIGHASEAQVIKAVLSQPQKTSSHWWEFGAGEQSTTSSCTNTTDKPGKVTYVYADYGKPSPLPFPDIVDNTEGVGSFEELIKYFPKGALVLDIGGGKFDSVCNWVMQRRPDVTMVVADPFNRSMDHNVAVQRKIESAGGADIVTSNSVLNVVPDVKSRISHILLVQKTLKNGGIAIFKTWAGVWPVRGTRKQEIETTDKDGKPIDGGGWCQNNSWASAYLPHIAAVFGDSNVFANDNENILFAYKPAIAT